MYSVERMDRVTADIISRWDFGLGFEFYNINEDPYVIETFLNGHYYTVYKENEIFGFFCDGETARMNELYDLDEHIIDIGFALNPQYIGKGYGQIFVKQIMQFYAHYTNFRLTVASFNQRAIKLYQKMGFQRIDTFNELIDGEHYCFYVMVLNQSQD
ncbi:GNAT family N-acetyltransferase [Macrococcoides caseolyticum]|uniref:GNAT family N-acetyltransferase n=1 Tax=Macrococcoides caseolyticum TaxID=69966 RepID=UPI001F41849A|nr:GNAT family N-acetyltransferase [Macrococcus caseolyticus]MCE4956226.1 GNAT family N-acetyltransferase [Macrococcus caseolyticus]